MGKRQYKQPHTPFPKRHTALFVCIFGPCGESGHSALGGNSKLVTRSFLSQTNTTRRKSCWRQIVPSESKANMYRPYFWVLCQNIEIYCSQGVGKKNQQSYQLFWNSNNNKKKKKWLKYITTQCYLWSLGWKPACPNTPAVTDKNARFKNTGSCSYLLM